MAKSNTTADLAELTELAQRARHIVDSAADDAALDRLRQMTVELQSEIRHVAKKFTAAPG
jgi:hypothetical protein